MRHLNTRDKSAPDTPDDLFSVLWQADGSSFASEEIAHENSLVDESVATELAIGVRASIQDTMTTPYDTRVDRLEHESSRSLLIYLMCAERRAAPQIVSYCRRRGL